MYVLLRVSIHALLSSRIRMLASIAFRDVAVRRRSIAIVFFGLMLGSAVITSSLAVGDSFDATLEDRLVSESWPDRLGYRRHRPNNGYACNDESNTNPRGA